MPDRGRRCENFARLFDNDLFDDMFAQSLIDKLDDPVLLIQQLLAERGDCRVYVECLAMDADLIGITGNGLSHDLLPDVAYLQSLNGTF